MSTMDVAYCLCCPFPSTEVSLPPPAPTSPEASAAGLSAGGAGQRGPGPRPSSCRLLREFHVPGTAPGFLTSILSVDKSIRSCVRCGQWPSF